MGGQCARAQARAVVGQGPLQDEVFGREGVGMAEPAQRVLRRLGFAAP